VFYIFCLVGAFEDDFLKVKKSLLKNKQAGDF
jgi:hypothetical protein